MVPRLRFQILYLYGDALPRYDHDDLNFLFNSPKLKLIAPLIETIFDLGDHYFLKRSIMSYLQTKQVRLVLAQFGPAGVEMMPVTTDLGIPLVVYFHGYDIFRKDTVEALLPQYRELFQKAAKILCVSAMMQDRLVQLGAPREKVFHLPAFVNLGQFPYSDHAGLPPNFLAVGRFAETKSPHLTILAFEKVVHRIPDARLTFIGQGGGGELFEACIILVKALKLENHVVFKGVQGHEAVAHEMAVNRIFVQHSLTTPIQGEMEGKPVAIMEAMAAGMPIVTTRHSGIAELIEHEVTGLLVSEYDINAMADGMIRLALDDELAGRLGWAAADWIRHEPLIAQNLEYLEDVLMQCIQ
jgi:glycosyltransferase involved in cell wall biosynthesis